MQDDLNPSRPPNALTGSIHTEVEPLWLPACPLPTSRCCQLQLSAPRVETVTEGRPCTRKRGWLAVQAVWVATSKSSYRLMGW
jgi:hypothetical protein